MSDDRPRSMKG